MPVYDPRGGGLAHIDVMLTNISVGYEMEDLVGDALFPTVRVTKQSDKYYIFGKESWVLPPEGDARAPGAVSNELPGVKLSEDQYFATEHALHMFVHDEERENADAPLNPDREATELTTQAILLGREKSIHTLVTTASNYPAAHTVTLTGMQRWNDYVNSDPIKNVKDARNQIRRAIFRAPNLAIIPWEVMSVLEDHPDFIERIKYSQRGVVTEELIATLFNIPRIIVPAVAYNSANPGQAENITFMWGKDVFIGWVPTNPGRRTPGFGYEFVWPINGRVQVTERRRDSDRKSDRVEVRRRYDLKIVAKDSNGKALAGYIIKTAVD